MDVKQAIGRARNYLSLVFSDEKIEDFRLEEVSFDRDDRSWLITFGILRSDEVKPIAGTIADLVGTPPRLERSRAYKVVRLPTDDDDPPSIRIRELANG